MATGYSVKLPLSVSSVDGPYALNKNLTNVVKQNIKMVVFTSPGERIMDNYFGVGIRNYLFEPLTDITKSNIRDRIIKQINRYLPFVNITSLGVYSNDNEPNKIDIKMEYTFPSSDLQILNIVVR
jgi:phage baseplate assembly protein W